MSGSRLALRQDDGRNYNNTHGCVPTHAGVYLVYGLWFESIPRLVQCTENTISDHLLLKCSVFNIELRKRGGSWSNIQLLLRKLRTLSGCNLAMALVYLILT